MACLYYWADVFQALVSLSPFKGRNCSPLSFAPPKYKLSGLSVSSFREREHFLFILLRNLMFQANANTTHSWSGNRERTNTTCRTVIAGLFSIPVLNNTLRIHVPWNDANWNVFAPGTFKELPVSGLDHTYTSVGAGVPSMGFGKENKSSIAQSPQ
jgi:hypothetical protein